MTEEEKAQKDLEAQLAKSDVKVSGDAADKMKENILKVQSDQPWLGVGVHDVKVTGVELTQAKTGTLGVKLTVANDDGKNEVTMWLSERALPYTIENISRIGVHNTPEEKREALRNAMTNINSAKDAYEVVKGKFVGFQCWLSVRESKTDTYTDKNGETKPSLDRNLLSYKPKETQTQAIARVMDGGEPLKVSDLPF